MGRHSNNRRDPHSKWGDPVRTRTLDVETATRALVVIGQLAAPAIEVIVRSRS